MKAFINTIIVVAALVGIGFALLVFKEKLGSSRPEKNTDQITRLRSEAPGKLLEACTNYVVGITRIISYDTFTSDDGFRDWTGKAVVEHVNRYGGIERTNLSFVFKTGPGFGEDAPSRTLRCYLRQEKTY